MDMTAIIHVTSLNILEN